MSSLNKRTLIESGPPFIETSSGHDVHYVYRPSVARLINLDTRFAYSSSDNTQFGTLSKHTIPLPARITEVRSICVRSIEIPVTFDTFSNQLDNTSLNILNNDTSQEYDLVLRDGTYTLSQLETEMNYQLQTTLGLTDLVFAVENSKATFTSTTASYSFRFESLSSIVRGRLGWLLGFRSKYLQTNASNSTSVSGTCVIDVNPIRYIYLALNDQSMGSTSFECPTFHSTNIPHVIARIAFDGQAKHSVLVASERKGNMVSDVRFFKNKIIMQRIGVSLLDERGVPLDCGGADLSLVIEIKHE